MAKCEGKKKAATSKAEDLQNKKKKANALLASCKATADKVENRNILKGLAEKITVEHHESINKHFKLNDGKAETPFFEHFVGLLRDINAAVALDVMLYF